MVMMVWAHNENSKKQIATEKCRMGTRGNKKEGKTQRKMNGWRKLAFDSPWIDKRELQRRGYLEKISSGCKKTPVQ
jgi:hypothetical protein